MINNSCPQQKYFLPVIYFFTVWCFRCPLVEEKSWLNRDISGAPTSRNEFKRWVLYPSIIYFLSSCVQVNSEEKIRAVHKHELPGDAILQFFGAGSMWIVNDIAHLDLDQYWDFLVRIHIHDCQSRVKKREKKMKRFQLWKSIVHLSGGLEVLTCLFMSI